MSFLYLFDLLDFDNKGNIAEANLAQGRSNFLYLISKYNQIFLKEKGLAVPEFFKSELSSVLKNVEAGGDYSFAKKQVFSACLPQVFALLDLSEKDAILALNSMVSVDDVEFAEKMKTAKNTLQLEYIMTITAGKIFNKAEALKVQEMTKENKSKLFKEVIKYNALILATSKVREQTPAQTQTVAG